MNIQNKRESELFFMFFYANQYVIWNYFVSLWLENIINVVKGERNRIYSILLLVIFLPVVLVPMFHIHHSSIDVDNHCQKCVEHQPHETHFSAIKVSVSDICRLCHLSSLKYIKSEVQHVVVTFISLPEAPRRRYIVIERHERLTATRAPPFVSVS